MTNVGSLAWAECDHKLVIFSTLCTFKEFITRYDYKIV